MEGFDLLVKWMAKHLPSLDLSGLVVDDVEKELISDHLTKATMENVMEETTDVAEGMKEATIVTPTDPVPNHYLLFFLSFFKKKKKIISLQGKNNISIWARCFGQLNNSFDNDR